MPGMQPAAAERFMEMVFGPSEDPGEDVLESTEDDE